MNAPAKNEKWWKHPRAQKAIRIGGIATGVGLVIWFFFYRPYVTTDDARVSATLVRLAPEGASG
ncbi:MAG TPA: hypothetical protein VL588_01595, partial [Bdellovibrionota bacterium]|nr:hypothetical protein [Bdellovibrionota bacterium]